MYGLLEKKNMNQNYTSNKKAICAMTVVAAAWQTDSFVCAPVAYGLRLKHAAMRAAVGLKGGVR